MNAKPTKPRNSGASRRKPATIDLEAKDVTKPEAEAPQESASRADLNAGANKADVSKTATAAARDKKSGAKLGRPTTASRQSASETAESKSSTDKAAKEPDAPAKSTSRSGGGFMSGLMGAGVAVIALGALGMVDGAKNIPVIGSLYGGHSDVVEDARVEMPSDLMQRIEALENIGAASENTAATVGGMKDQLDELGLRVNGLSDGSSNPGLQQAATELAKRLDVLETTVSSFSGSAVDALAENLNALENRIEQLELEESADLAPLQDSLQEMKTNLAEISSRVSENTGKVNALNDQSDELISTVASVKASEKVARSVAISALGTALENDDPLTLVIASIKSLGVIGAETDRLAELDLKGVPTRKMLLKDLASFTNTIQNPQKDTHNGTLSERFWANAQNLVSFRSSGPQEGTSAVAILSRVKAHIEDDNLAMAEQEWRKLPAELKEAGASWANNLSVRMEAFALQNSLSKKLSAVDG